MRFGCTLDCRFRLHAQSDGVLFFHCSLRLIPLRTLSNDNCILFRLERHQCIRISPQRLWLITYIAFSFYFSPVLSISICYLRPFPIFFAIECANPKEWCWLAIVSVGVLYWREHSFCQWFCCGNVIFI